MEASDCGPHPKTENEEKFGSGDQNIENIGRNTLQFNIKLRQMQNSEQEKREHRLS